MSYSIDVDLLLYGSDTSSSFHSRARSPREPANPPRLASVVLIVAGIVGLELVLMGCMSLRIWDPASRFVPL